MVELHAEFLNPNVKIFENEEEHLHVSEVGGGICCNGGRLLRFAHNDDVRKGAYKNR